MVLNNLILGLFAVIIVVPVLFMLFTSNIIRAAFAFAMALLGMAGLYVLLNAELMAVVQIMIYAGGVIVLLLFGVMLTKRKKTEGVFTKHRDVALGVGLVMVLFSLLVGWIGQSGLEWKESEPITQNQVTEIGILFLTDHLISFEIVAFLLLVVLVGAALLAKKSGNA